MKSTSAVDSLTNTAQVNSLKGDALRETKKPGSMGFSELLKGLQEAKPAINPVINLEAILNKAIKYKKLDPVELIQAQVAIGRYQLKAEIMTKFAEGINSTLRRVQQS